jgi:transposase
VISGRFVEEEAIAVPFRLALHVQSSFKLLVYKLHDGFVCRKFGVRMQAYSQDLRERVLRALDRGDRPTVIAQRFEVSRIWVHQVQRRLEQTGQRSSFQIGGYRRSQLANKEAMLRGWIAAEPFLTLAELQQRLSQQGVSIKIGTLWHHLNKWNLTLKKNTERQMARTRERAVDAARIG